MTPGDRQDDNHDNSRIALTSGRRLALALTWLALLLLAGWGIAQRLELSGDLRKFMPEASTPAQKLLLDELGEGPGSRLLLVGLAGAPVDVLATQSSALSEALGADEQFEFVTNGDQAGLEAIPQRLRPYRYLMSPTLDRHALDREYLGSELADRVQDLGSPAASMIEPLLPADPTLEMVKLAQSWQPANAPQRLHGVWFDRDGERALLLLQTRAAGFDPTGQELAINRLQAAFDKISGDSGSRMVLSGPGAFSVEIGNRTAREASLIGSVDTLLFVLLLALAYRSWRAPLLGGLPLASGGLAGLAVVALGFEGVHGITVAFGFTLIGVAQDYPIHLFSHQRPGLSPWKSARSLWPTLGTGVAATCIAYLTFFVSGVDGLRQLAVFTIVGLAVAALTTRFMLPALLDNSVRGGSATDTADSPRMARLWARLAGWPRMHTTGFLVTAALAMAVVVLAPGAFWQNDLSKLTPAPPELLARDAQLRESLGAPDVRYLIALQGKDLESVLQRSETLQPALQKLRSRGALGGFDMAARYLPSIRTQRARQARLPDASALQTALDDALADSPFQPDAFTDFSADVAIARAAEPLVLDDLRETPLATRVGGLLLQQDDHVTALISLTALTDPASVAEVARANGAQLLDLKQASESLVAEYRGRVLWALVLAALLLAGTVWVSLRSLPRTLRVLAPMALTTLLVLAVLRAIGVELNLFHLVSLILAAGLGLDYALFFDHAGDDRGEQLRTLHAVIVCSLTTFLVFSLLALSSIPVLRAIGGPVALGVVINFVLALLIVRRPATMELDDANDAVNGDGATHASA